MDHEQQLQHCEKCEDMNRFNLLKQKNEITPRNEIIEMLTLVSESWSINKIANAFNKCGVTEESFLVTQVQMKNNFKIKRWITTNFNFH